MPKNFPFLVKSFLFYSCMQTQLEYNQYTLKYLFRRYSHIDVFSQTLTGGTTNTPNRYTGEKSANVTSKVSSGDCSRARCWWQDAFSFRWPFYRSCFLYAASAKLYFLCTPAHLPSAPSGSRTGRIDTQCFHPARDERRGLEMAHLSNVCPVVTWSCFSLVSETESFLLCRLLCLSLSLLLELFHFCVFTGRYMMNPTYWKCGLFFFLLPVCKTSCL